MSTNKRFAFFGALMLLILPFCLKSQVLTPQVLSNAGNTIVTAQGRLSWTFGEGSVASIQASGGVGTLTEGFHQGMLQVSDPIFTESALVKILPNPVQEVLNILPVLELQDPYMVNLIDAQGRNLIKDRKLTGKTAIDMSAYSAGVYFLSIHQVGKPGIQNQKIIKL
jgi:hypothetical protein